MKLRIIFLQLCFLICTTSQSQSNTQELIPVFHKNPQAYISDIVDFDPIANDISFVGISCYHFDPDYRDIKYRVLQEDGWSVWETFSPQHELGERVRTAYEGKFVLSTFSSIQFMSIDKLDTPLTVRFYFGKQQSSLDLPLQKSTPCALPEVCDRSCWCSDCPIDNTPELTAPTHVIVHHSAGSNEPDFNHAEVVNYIWDLHVNTNGWDDVGYNWLIDPDGVLYEGRPDGYQGAHFSCINENTIGICLLGDFTMISPTEEAVNTLVDLVAFEAIDHDIDVLNESYHETGEFEIANVAGHRESSGSTNSCSTTACPGDAFYPMLDMIRQRVADLPCYQNSISASEILDKRSWSVFPNPFQNTLKIEREDLSRLPFEIKDIDGKSCGILISNIPYDLSHLAYGLYFIIHEGRIVEKAIKQH